MNFQKDIDSIIVSSNSKEDTLKSLAILLSQQKDVLFCDFDDTLIQSGISTEAYYRGYCHGVALFGNNASFSPPQIVLSSIFLDNVPTGTHSLVILTRNFLPFVQGLVQNIAEDLSRHNLEIVGIVGKVPWTVLDLFTSLDKLAILPNWGILATDVFEYRALCHDKRCVFLPPPFRAPHFLIITFYYCIKLRDYVGGFMSVFLTDKTSKWA
jgi:hypothetical protein